MLYYFVEEWCFMKKVILIDGNNLMFRSYFATAYTGNVMRNSKGQATNALYGFVSMLKKIIEEENPQYMVVAFDIGKNFRHDKYKDYKAGRNETPDDLLSQMPIARRILDAMGIKHLECEGYEADDIIGTLAKEADEDPEYDGLIISSDHDLMQLISPVVGMKMLKGQGGSVYYTVDTFKEEYGFDPIKIIDLKALMGDASDNIPGVKGIGEKTAKSLIQQYGSLDGVYQNIDSIKGKMKEKLEADKDNAYFSYELATIYREVPLDVKLGELTYAGPELEALKEIYQELEFHSYLKTLVVEQKRNVEVEYKIVNDITDIEDSLEFSYFIECDRDNYHYAEVLGMSLYDGKTMYFVPKEAVLSVLEKFGMQLRYTYSLKKNIVLAHRLGVDLASTDFDLMIAYYLLDNNIKDDLAIAMGDEGMEVYYYENLVKKKVLYDDMVKGLVLKAKFIWDEKDKILDRIAKSGMGELFNKIEMPLVRVLADMEETGIRVDRDILREMQKSFKEHIDALEKEIIECAGFEFNVASPKQLGDALFNRLGIPYPGKKTTSYSTDVSILEKLTMYEIVPKILEYRTFSKLYNTYVEPLESFIKEDGKIHTIYKQTLTRTGRLSSVEPNLQNIPTREEEGKLVKRAFISEEGAHFLSADYSQIELRILASFSEDETMINAFLNDEDIHRRVAADIHGKALEDVTSYERSTAKAVIFGIVYGISGYGLGENLNISPKDAKAFIEKYYKMYPKVKEYMDSIKEQAYDSGYVTTLFGRVRHIDELKSPVYMVRAGGERIALNTPIQGTGADIIKIAMVNLYRDLHTRGLKSKIILQVHDEVILNVYDDEAEEVLEIVKKAMENAADLKVPLKVGISMGKDWYETK